MNVRAARHNDSRVWLNMVETALILGTILPAWHRLTAWEHHCRMEDACPLHYSLEWIFERGRRAV